MRGFAILLGFSLAGALLHDTLHLPLPGNVIGLLLFLAALFGKVVKLEWVEASADLLTGHLLLFFIPYVIGAAALIPFMGHNAVSIIVGVVGSTLAVLWVTGTVAAKTAPKSGEEARDERLSA
ncbi:CidA/LrgA family protein [Saccharibacillus sp. CPCC 101409]|uniref:CidA/LrgA family protein n=1 Tax=Saccharibacillus sp. CPCC 101409 TaxID=3058041 RepID=UPI002671D37A|nr:CidA/LrgA family protein [Saccharibacillus sp. CPCC 101409]MDO3412255.1 CidA/LrgA family protein [Saccharibacillus sp. CPCC 101409]